MFAIQFTTNRRTAITLRQELASLGWEVFSQKRVDDSFNIAIVLDTVHISRYSQLEKILLREARALTISPISPIAFWKELGA